ncbi:hypothetical protein Sjap_018612 [Stephania japonica]|uniref:Spatacsin C-terminal domain-containing protein n=1 Tax=Stephania japonica TaxID=461633 RepID=A0AAP0I8B4_9MAGN
MESSCIGQDVDHPSILRLQKWDPYQMQLNPSEFCDAFLSPTKKLLLLLSHQSEAFLLPLVTGYFLDRNGPNGYNSECHQDSNISDINSSACVDSCFSESLDDIPCTSGYEEVDSCQAFTRESSSLKFEHCRVICDAKSLAWGHCGDAYNQHKDITFSELLFVSGDHGVTAHAFCRKDNVAKKVLPESMFRQGRWVEWGPATINKIMQNKQSNFCCNDMGVFYQGDNDNRNEEVLLDGSVSDVDGARIGRSTSKKWLRTFLTEAETREVDGDIWTILPSMPTDSCSAEVVSFSIFDCISLLLEFLSHEDLMPVKKEKWTAATALLRSVRHSNSGFVDQTVSLHSELQELRLEACNLFRCLRIFSSSSHRLVGFVLKLVNPLEENGESVYKIYVAIIMLFQSGIKWISSVELKDMHQSPDQNFEWTDFQFSDNLLLCLNTCGVISVYDTTIGKLVECIDVLRISSLSSPLNSLKQAKDDMNDDLRPSGTDNQEEKHQEVSGKTINKSKHYLGHRRFKKLMVASSCSYLAVADEYGIVYLICLDVYFLEKYCWSNQLLPHFQHFGLGWEVGGAAIGCQRVLSDPSHCHREDIKSLNMQRWPFKRKESQHDFFLSGFSVSSQIKDQDTSHLKSSLNPVRRMFFPVDGFNEDDSISFSLFGVTRLVKQCKIGTERGFKIVHTHLHLSSEVNDDEVLNFQTAQFNSERGAFVGEVIGFSYQGCLYLVTRNGLSVVLPSVSVSSNALSVGSMGYWQPSLSTGSEDQTQNILESERHGHISPWKMELLDRALLYEGPEVADHLCSENGWDLKIARIRQLQLGLDYLEYNEIEKSLEKLMDVNLAEEGVLRLLFTSIYQIFCKVGNDSEVALASRLLSLAANFATNNIRKYGLLLHKKIASDDFRMISDMDRGNLRRLQEMAHFLEVIRKLQSRLAPKLIKSDQGLSDDGESSSTLDAIQLQNHSHLGMVVVDDVASEMQNQHELACAAPGSVINEKEKLALMPVESFESSCHTFSENFNVLSIPLSEVEIQGKKMIPSENPKDMISRWEVDNLDLKTVVGDALRSGRLPLAVLQLHLQHLRDLVTEKESQDTFGEVREIGRAIAYDLFLKGETGLAVATLQRLGEDIEVVLRQLLVGTVRRSLRQQVADAMQGFGYLAPYEWKMLERISLIERLYPSCSFWKTFLDRQKISSSSVLPEEKKFFLKCSDSLVIECGDIDGVVIGPWANIKGSTSFPVADAENAHAGYWTAAAVWSDAWDQETFDRIVLDQPFLMGVHVSWESQLEYHSSHNDWEEVSKLLDMIPASLLSGGSLQINRDGASSAVNTAHNSGYTDYRMYIYPPDELEPVCIDIPNIKLLKYSASKKCSMWLRMLMEEELAKKFIFLKEYREGTAEILHLLSRAGFISKKIKAHIETESIPSLHIAGSSSVGGEHEDALQALHNLVIHHCVKYGLPSLLDLYLDHHKLVLDNESLAKLQEAAGDCEWAKWLLLSRVKGREYDASLSNARSIVSNNIVSGSNLSILEVDDIIHTVDDMAEGGGEMAALATLMFASAPIQSCLSSGSVNRNFSSSAQCTLENLRPALQRFPTLWRTLIATCFGQDVTSSSLIPNAKSVFGNSALSEFLNWRETIFSSSGRDTSLAQMLPGWFSTPIRRLVELFVQGSFNWQTLAVLSAGESFIPREADFFITTRENAEVSAISWEAAIQKRVEVELYASSFEKTGSGVENYLQRGRALGAFSYLIDERVQKLKSSNGHQKQSGGSSHGQASIQSDVQMLLAPVTQSEESLLASVLPLAVLHFQDTVLVASCALLLELCGLSARMIQVDIAALRRISSFCEVSELDEHFKHLSPKGSAFNTMPQEGDIALSLAHALADDYLHQENISVTEQNGATNGVASLKKPSRALLSVLNHLEKASLPLMTEGNTCGSWLKSGVGNGSEFRSEQKAASQKWSLVSSFCQMHHMPLSTKYLAVLAKDNDWVGFLTEAQIGGYPFEMIVEVASKEFSDQRLMIHVLTVLRSMYSTRRKTSSTSISAYMGKSNEVNFSTRNNVASPAELFKLLAESEKQKKPGETLLVKAKDLRWSLLAIIASCFPDVSPLQCLTVWLEVTAARETSSIKVNDIASQIAVSVGAAVASTNRLPIGSRTLTFHYNRRNAKRRRLIEPTSSDPQGDLSPNAAYAYSNINISIEQDIMVEEETQKQVGDEITILSDPDEALVYLSKMVGVLCDQRLFLPLLRAFEMFLPSCSLLPFLRALQAFSQMRLSEASAHLTSFSTRIKEEALHAKTNLGKEMQIATSWISSTAVTAADALLSTCPSAYEKRCLLKLLAATDFGDGGSATTFFSRCFWKINLAEPSLRKDEDSYLGNERLDDASLLAELEKNGRWEHARNWARQLEASGTPWKSAVHHVTETQAEAMVAEWKEFLWDVPEERASLWSHCQTLFLRYSFPPLQAGLFFLKHAEAIEKLVPAKELHEMLLLSLQWLSGTMTKANPVYPLNLLREIETRVWLLAVESEAQMKTEGNLTSAISGQSPMNGNSSSVIEQTAGIITKMDNHLKEMKSNDKEKSDARDINLMHLRNQQALDASSPATAVSSAKVKRKTKGFLPYRRPQINPLDKSNDPEDGSGSPVNLKNDNELFKSFLQLEENVRLDASASRWEERVEPEELERAVLSLLEFGQVTAARQLQQKLSPGNVPCEFSVVDAALKLAAISTPSCSDFSLSMLDPGVLSVVQSYNLMSDDDFGDPLQVLENLTIKCSKDCGLGLCERIVAVVKAANVLGLSFSEAYTKHPLELLQLLSLKAQDSLEEAKLLVQTHSMPPASVAQILAESFLKGLLAAHRGGYMDFQKEEGPAPLLWRISDFYKWAELCPSEPEIGHALMRLVITGQEIPHACEVELLILSHHFYKSSACLDGVDVLVELAGNRVDSYVAEGDFSCLARLVTGVSNFHALNFILGMLIENGQLELLLQKYSAAEIATGSAESVRGFRMAVLTALKKFNPYDFDAFAMVYNHFDMKHETASLLESRAVQSVQQWSRRYDKDLNEDLLEAMHYYIEAAEVHSTIDAGNKTHRACSQAALLSLQIRLPDFAWLGLSETNARRALVEQSRFQEALIVAEAYNLNQPGEWAPVLWNQMLKPELIEQFVAEFVAVLPLQSSMLAEVARYYRAEVAARVDQSHFSVWLSPGGLPAEWLKHLSRSFRCLLKRTRDLRVRLQLATIATGFADVIEACSQALDKVPDNAGPLVLRKGHGGGYLPLM